MRDEALFCDTCERDVAVEETRRTETYAGLDPEKWQVLCCPHCGNRLKTVFVGDER